jgi:hypothetical protein
MPLPIIAGLAIASRVALAAKRVFNLRKKMRRVGSSTKKSNEKKSKMAIQLGKEVKSAGEGLSRKVINKADQMIRNTSKYRNKSKKK